jgi:hypothetical protein
MWRSCNLTPIHSLTGPVDQPLHPVQQVSASHPGDEQTHNGTGFLLLALSRYIGDPDMIDHRPPPRLRANNRKFHYASHQWCEKPAVITHCLPRFHSTPCRSSSSSQQSDRWPVSAWSSCWGEPCGGPAISLQDTDSLVQWVNCLLPV